MLSKSFLVVVTVGVGLVAAPSCQPEAFHETLGAGGSGGLAGNGGSESASAGVGGSADLQGTAGLGRVGVGSTAGTGGDAGSGGGTGAGSAGRSEAAGMAGSSGASGSTPTAGAAGQRADAGTRSDARTDTSERALDAVPEAPLVNPYSSASWKATASATAKASEGPSNAFDGNVGTRWATGQPQMGNEFFEIDFGKTLSVSRVVLDDTIFPQDFPVAYVFETSTDGTTFMAVRMGMGATVTDIQFATVNAHNMRIRQTANGPKWWSIGELSVYP
jgi:hypothetical protein